MYYLKYYALAFLLCIGILTSQEMAPNPTFEINPLLSPQPCPYGASTPTLDNVTLSLMKPGNIPTWIRVPNSHDADYYNSCVTASPCTIPNVAAWANVPNTRMGYQQALSGNGFVGLSFWYVSLDPTLPCTDVNKTWTPSNSEYIQAQLITPMKKGNSYKVQFHVSLSPFSNAYEQTEFGAYFSTNPVVADPNNRIIYYSPQVHCGMTGLNYNQTNWTPIKGNFIANGNLNYITIGNFFSVNRSVPLHTPQAVCWADPNQYYVTENGGAYSCLHAKHSYYYVDTDGNTPMVQECKCEDDLEIILVPITGVDDGDDCCYTIKLKNNGTCTQEVIGLRIKDLGYRFAGASNGDLKVIPEIKQTGDDVGFFVQETYTSSLENGLSIAPNGERVLGTLCLTPGTAINGKFILLRNENVGGVYQEKCEKEKTFAECTHSNSCCGNVLKYLKVTSMDKPYLPAPGGGTPPIHIPATSCCNKIEGELTQANNPCGFVVKIERLNSSGNWETLSSSVSITNGKFSLMDCENRTKGRYRISLQPSSGVACIFMREAKCKATCCIEDSDINIYDVMGDGTQCCFKMDITIPVGSCITNAKLQTGNQLSTFQLNPGINTLSLCVSYPGERLKFILGKSSGESECEAFVDIPCSNCCPKLGNIGPSNIIPGPSNAQECCYIINGTVDNSTNCYQFIEYQTYNKATNSWDTQQATINGNNYSFAMCVKPTTETGKKYSITPLYRSGAADYCKREFELPCLPDCCPRITITRVLDMTGNCCYTVEGIISGHETDPCFANISFSTYVGNGQWVQTTMPINSNGTFSINVCVPINPQGTPVVIDFNTNFGTKCSQTLNLVCGLDGGGQL